MEEKIIGYITKDIGGEFVELYKSKPIYSAEKGTFYPSNSSETGSDILDGQFDGFVKEGECIEIIIKIQRKIVISEHGI